MIATETELSLLPWRWMQLIKEQAVAMETTQLPQNTFIVAMDDIVAADVFVAMEMDSDLHFTWLLWKSSPLFSSWMMTESCLLVAMKMT